MNRPSLLLHKIYVALIAFVFSGVACLAQVQSGTQPRVVLKGHDPVAYFTEKKPVKGDAKLSYDWDGARYYFANAENRKKFASDPDRYEPQFAGYCTGSMARGVRNEADPDAWLIADGRLFMFGSVKFRDMAKNDKRWLDERVALAGENYRTKK